VVAGDLQALGIEPRFPCFGVFVEVWDVRVKPVPVFIAHDLDGADQLFFGHDFVLAAIAADVEGGGERFGGNLTAGNTTKVI
jgi:hypothetical protein